MLARQEESQERLKQHLREKAEQAQENHRLQLSIQKEKQRLLQQHALNNKSVRLLSLPSDGHSEPDRRRASPVSIRPQASFVRKYAPPAKVQSTSKKVGLPIQEEEERTLENTSFLEMVNGSKAFCLKHSALFES